MNIKRDDIEDLILNNLESLNDAEPKDGHFERFEQKLEKQSNSKNTFKIVWRIAAVAVFAFLVVNQAIIYLTPEPKEINTLGAISKEYAEVEFYYTNSINVGISQWEQMYNAGLLTDDDNQLLQDELVEFDQMYKKLQADLKSNPYDERVINAMLEYYQSKLNVINLIVEKLNQVKTINNKENETKI